MKLHQDKELFEELIEVTANHLGIPPLYIEKDYWVSYILKKLSMSTYKDVVIFKGGTSLSKAYKIIERFSEDIDLAVITENLSGNEIKNLIRNIEKSLLDDNFIENVTSDTSKGSQFRKTIHQYPKIMNGDFGHANEYIMLEINSFSSPNPFEEQTISTYIGEFLSIHDEALLSKYDLDSFEVNVLDYRRTFCEKLSAIARASFESDKNLTSLKEKIRHFYDIYFLMKEDNIVRFLNSQDFIHMLKKVKANDKIQFNNDRWTKQKFSTNEIFVNTEVVLKQLEKFYIEHFSELVYGLELPSTKLIQSELEKIQEILVVKNL